MSYLETQPIRKGDVVKVIGKKTPVNGAKGVVEYVDNLTAIAFVRCNRGSGKIHVSDLELIDRPMPQPKLF